MKIWRGFGRGALNFILIAENDLCVGGSFLGVGDRWMEKGRLFLCQKNDRDSLKVHLP